MKKIVLVLVLALGACTMFIASAWLHTTVQLARARANGVYPSAEEGMLAQAAKFYTPDRDVKILYAGTNSFDGSRPHVWYVIAEIHASARADGSELGYKGCDAPGMFFLETRDGWVTVPEGAFPGFMGFWMEVFQMAGPGQSTPSTNWAPDQPSRFCGRPPL